MDSSPYELARRPRPPSYRWPVALLGFGVAVVGLVEFPAQWGWVAFGLLLGGTALTVPRRFSYRFDRRSGEYEVRASRLLGLMADTRRGVLCDRHVARVVRRGAFPEFFDLMLEGVQPPVLLCRSFTHEGRSDEETLRAAAAEINQLIADRHDQGRVGRA